MSATPIPQERRKQIVKVIFISLLLDLVSMIASFDIKLAPVSLLTPFYLDLLHLYLAAFPQTP